jgi:hypothetical protein
MTVQRFCEDRSLREQFICVLAQAAPETTAARFALLETGPARQQATMELGMELALTTGELVANRRWSGFDVIILGTNLTRCNRIIFNGTATTFTVVSSSEITTTVPVSASHPFDRDLPDALPK